MVVRRPEFALWVKAIACGGIFLMGGRVRIGYGRRQQQVRSSRQPRSSPSALTGAGFNYSNDASLSCCSCGLCSCCAGIQRHQPILALLYFSVRTSIPVACFASFALHARTLANLSRLPPSLQDASVAQIQSSQAVLETAKQFLSSCPTDVYYIIQQPSVLSSDLSPSSIPNLQAALSSSAVKAKYLVSETRGLGNDVKQELLGHLRKSCGEMTVLDKDEPIQTAEALFSQISRSLKGGKKALILRTMEELAGPRMSTQRAAMLNDIGTASVPLLYSQDPP